MLRRLTIARFGLLTGSRSSRKSNAGAFVVRPYLWQEPCSTRTMASYSMNTLKDLRTQSGAPVVECKKALEQVGDDFAKAMDWLREHGAAKASSKVQDRETNEGLVGIEVSEDGKSASIVKVASETDFAGRSRNFVDFVSNVALASLNADPTVNERSILDTDIDGKTVKNLLDESIVAIRENLNIVKAIKVESTEGFLVGYVHNRMDSSNAGTAASLVELVPVSGNAIDKGTIEEIGKRLAMHIVAARPTYVSPSDVPSDEVEKERVILMKQNADSGKPPEILEKIVDGKLRKFYESICLTEQPHMIEEKNPKVSKVLKASGLEAKSFHLFYIA